MPEREDGRYLTRELFYAEHEELTARVASLETEARSLSGAEQVHQTLTARITALEQEAHHDQAAEQSRRDRLWVLALTLISGVVFPILVTAVLTYLHLHAAH